MQRTMEFLCLIWLLPLLLLIFFLLHQKPRHHNLPPQPPTLPIIGNLNQLGSLPHRSLRNLSNTYGPLMYLKLGQLPTIVVSSPSMAGEILKTQDLNFCTRPPLSGVRKLYYDGLGIAFSPYNAHWRQAKRICVAELLSPSKVESLRPVREEEVRTLVSTIRQQSEREGMVNLSEMFLCLLNNITCREVFGRRFGREGECGRSRFHDLVTEWTRLMGHFNVGEFFPSMEWINILTGFHGRFKKNFMEMDSFLNDVIDAHVTSELNQDCILSILLELRNDPSMEIPLTKDRVKAILMDLFIAGTDTAAIALEWGMSELIRNPDIMARAQVEVRSLVGPKERVEESDLHQLHYLKRVTKEILRLHPPGPFLLPRRSRTDCTVGGYKIPAHTTVTVNAWAIGRDPNVWDRPEEFWPERFDDNSVDYRDQHFKFLPFGSGRRGCPGISLGTVVLELALANLLHVFDWEVNGGLNGEELDMEEAFGIVIRRKSALSLIAIPRGNGVCFRK